LSPTFTIVSEYATGASTLYHIDLYRIEGREQQENLGLDDILRGEGIVLVEWGEKLDPSFAGGGLRVIIDISPDGGRDIRVEAAVSAAVSRQRTAPGTMG
jgi:tRNA threonylcarbamoyladenosine biosynthesis protein TsaE